MFLLGVFVSFVGGTTLFLHTHILEGAVITHSHPYLPSVPHSHTTQSFQFIASAMSAAQQVLPSDELYLSTSFVLVSVIDNVGEIFFISVESATSFLRAPPVDLFFIQFPVLFHYFSGVTDSRSI